MYISIMYSGNPNPGENLYRLMTGVLIHFLWIKLPNARYLV